MVGTSVPIFMTKYFMLKKILLNPWMALLTLVLVVGARYADPSFVESVRLRYFDQELYQSQQSSVLG